MRNAATKRHLVWVTFSLKEKRAFLEDYRMPWAFKTEKREKGLRAPKAFETPAALGPRGPPGPQGPWGPQGPQGPWGPL